MFILTINQNTEWGPDIQKCPFTYGVEQLVAIINKYIQNIEHMKDM